MAIIFENQNFASIAIKFFSAYNSFWVSPNLCRQQPNMIVKWAGIGGKMKRELIKKVLVALGLLLRLIASLI